MILACHLCGGTSGTVVLDGLLRCIACKASQGNPHQPASRHVVFPVRKFAPKIPQHSSSTVERNRKAEFGSTPFSASTVPSQSKRAGQCKYCKRTEPLTTHHIIPQRAGGRKGPTVRLCRACHNIADALADQLYPQKIKIQESAESCGSTIVPPKKVFVGAGISN